MLVADIDSHADVAHPDMPSTPAVRRRLSLSSPRSTAASATVSRPPGPRDSPSREAQTAPAPVLSSRPPPPDETPTTSSATVTDSVARADRGRTRESQRIRSIVASRAPARGRDRDTMRSVATQAHSSDSDFDTEARRVTRRGRAEATPRSRSLVRGRGRDTARSVATQAHSSDSDFDTHTRRVTRRGRAETSPRSRSPVRGASDPSGERRLVVPSVTEESRRRRRPPVAQQESDMACRRQERQLAGTAGSSDSDFERPDRGRRITRGQRAADSTPLTQQMPRLRERGVSRTDPLLVRALKNMRPIW